MCTLPTPTGGERTRRLIDALCRREPGTPLPVPLPFGRGEGASSAVLVHTDHEDDDDERILVSRRHGTLVVLASSILL